MGLTKANPTLTLTLDLPTSGLKDMTKANQG